MLLPRYAGKVLLVPSKLSNLGSSQLPTQAQPFNDRPLLSSANVCLLFFWP